MEEKKRGGCLTAYLVVIIIFSVLGIIGTFMSTFMTSSLLTSPQLTPEMRAALETSTNPFSMYSSMLFLLISTVGCILILMWKKLGVYLFVGSSIISMLIGFFSAASTTTILTSFISSLIYLGIFYLLIKNVYQHMK